MITIRSVLPLWTPVCIPTKLRFRKHQSVPLAALSSSAVHRKRLRPQSRLQMKVAVVGCAHGELDNLYAAIKELEQRQSTKVDLIICPGDFQAVRNESDLACMACPPKYRDMRSFWKYYNGSIVAPIPTLFVGGNHEASAHLQQLPLGGLVAPNIYFLGNAGVVNFGGLRIAGISGVYTERDYEKPRFEKPPYPKNQIKSVYHTRKQDVQRLLRLQNPVDIFISHDWPRGIWRHGDLSKLLSAKPFLRHEIENGTFGNPGTTEILDAIQPSFWFAAHMHVKFPAIIEHEKGARTKFLALDKILPRRDFVQLLDIPTHCSTPQHLVSKPVNVGEEGRVYLDPEWLSILMTEQSDPHRTTPVAKEDIEALLFSMTKTGVAQHIDLVNDFQPFAAAHCPSDGRMSPPTELEFHPYTLKLFECLGMKQGESGPRLLLESSKETEELPRIRGN
ncbi:unnamed protein product [Agarophyton chilense]